MIKTAADITRHLNDQHEAAERGYAKFKVRAMQEAIADAGEILRAASELGDTMGHRRDPALTAAFMTTVAINRAAALIVAELESIANATRAANGDV